MNYASSECFCVNRLSLNSEKHIFWLITNGKSYKNPVININDNVIQRVKATKNYDTYIMYMVNINANKSV